MLLDYEYKTVPFAHQSEAFLCSKNAKAFALLMEQGTGKTKVIIDNAAYLYCQGKINAAVIIAPNSIVSNWVDDEIPTHLPDYVPHKIYEWQSGATAKQKRELENIFRENERLVLFVINVEAFSSEKGKLFTKKILNYFKTLMVIDESTTIKTPGAARTKSIRALGRLADYRRIMTGTPITNSPLDLYAQFKFLDSSIIPNQTFSGFKSEYAIIEKKTNHAATQKQGKLVTYDQVLEYKNVNSLIELIRPYSFRCRKDDVLDLPPKVYQKRFIQMTPNQKRMYKEMALDAITSINGLPDHLKYADDIDKLAYFLLNKDVIKASQGGVKHMRLLQILGGFANNLPVDKTNNKINEVLNILDESTGKVLIWANFSAEIDALYNAITKKYGEGYAAKFNGEVSKDERREIRQTFQKTDDIQVIILQPSAGGVGLTLTKANTNIIYSNSYSYYFRAQLEDRTHRSGQTGEQVLYIDLVVKNTADSKALGSLLEKKENAKIIDNLCLQSK